MGGRLRYSIGKLSYSPSGLNGPPTKTALIVVVIVTVLLVVVFLLFIVAYRRKSTESNRVLKNMQEQMDILELRVAAECKEGMRAFVFFLLFYLCRKIWLRVHIVLKLINTLVSLLLQPLLSFKLK